MAAAASEARGAHLYSNSKVCSPSQEDDRPPSQPREIITPSITELTKEVRTNILCTVEGCGKILPNTPALNMHLVKSHRVKDGLINPTVRKDMKGSQKLYCCPMEGCPRGPHRPFSQFSLVKQHFMKMHAERKHRCAKCSNCYSTEWDLRRHAEDCGKTYHCTCGCPYASRAALLSHIYRTGHEVPTEHRYPPVKKRKMEGLTGGSTKVKFTEQTCPLEKEFNAAIPSADGVSKSDTTNQNLSPSKGVPKLLLPKPKVALLNVPVMQFAHVPVLLSTADSTPVRSVVLAVNNQASLMSTVHLVPQPAGSVMPTVNTKTWNLRETVPLPRLGLGPVSTGVQVNLESIASGQNSGDPTEKNSTSTNIQTDISYLSKSFTPGSTCILSESSVSSCSQTDISVSAQVQLPVSVETQTFPSQSKVTTSIGAQTDTFGQTCLPTYNITRETQTSASLDVSEDRGQMDQAIMCTDLFDGSSLSVSTQTTVKERPFRTDTVEESLNCSSSGLYDHKSVGVMCFGSQTELLQTNLMADNQTQTMALFNDLENILSHSMTNSPLSNATVVCEPGLSSVPEHNASIDFDFEEFLNAAHIQTQTEESELGTLTSETPLESLDIETQTDFLFLDYPAQNDNNPRPQSNYLGQETFDTQTQTDLNFLLDTSGPLPLGNFLKQSGFSMSTEASGSETHKPVQAISPASAQDSQIKLSSTETQTVSSSFESLGHLFLTSNETQTVMDDFLMADLAWNMDSHFSSVETQTCEELCSLFQHSEKRSN
ncbi:ATM interactor [Brienomyrus brachyistius]|uniref:ATM interactor n=1 Tax=Brienomyrus brachyistius TaxID=42636 RepID=UPI0020B2BF54|nr:ATM interactor [Brienomyrus brachyistius]